MVRRVILLVLLVLCAPVAAMAQEPGSIPEPNEVTEQLPPQPLPEAGLVAAVEAPSERFGGADGVFRFVVVGDPLARGLGAGLERLTDLDPRFEVVNRFNEASSVARPEIYNWPAAIPKILKSSSFDAVVVFMGVNDLRPIKVGDTRVELGTPEWTEAYKANVDQVLASIKDNGARVYWVTLPPMQKPEFEAQMQMISGLQRERVVSAGLALVDIRAVLLNPDGSYMLGDLDAKGKPRRLRAKDGINFTRVGNDYLADLVMGALRKGENVPELQSAKDEEKPAEPQIAVALPAASSPLLGQSGVDEVELTYEATALAKEVPQQLAPDLSNAGKLGLKIARNSLAQRFYRSGEVLGVPYGRFDDYSVKGPTP